VYNEKTKQNFKYNLKITEGTAAFWRPQTFALRMVSHTLLV